MDSISDIAAYLFELDRVHVLQAEFFTHDDRFLRWRGVAPDSLISTTLDALERGEGLASETLAQVPHSENDQLEMSLC